MRAKASGFTLIELMIVVVIIGILAALATIGYRGWIGKARSAEAASMLAEMNSKEQSYRMEFGTFTPLRADGNTAQPSPDEATSAFFPVSPNGAGFDSTRTANPLGDRTSWPASWRAVGLAPRDTSLYCTYMANAGGAGDAAPAGAPHAGALLTGTAAPWFYALAACNMSGPSGYPEEVTTFGVSSTTPGLKAFNEGH